MRCLRPAPPVATAWDAACAKLAALPEVMALASASAEAKLGGVGIVGLVVVGAVGVVGGVTAGASGWRGEGLGRMKGWKPGWPGWPGCMAWIKPGGSCMPAGRPPCSSLRLPAAGQYYSVSAGAGAGWVLASTTGAVRSGWQA